MYFFTSLLSSVWEPLWKRWAPNVQWALREKESVCATSKLARPSQVHCYYDSTIGTRQAHECVRVNIKNLLFHFTPLNKELNILISINTLIATLFGLSFVLFFFHYNSRNTSRGVFFLQAIIDGWFPQIWKMQVMGDSRSLPLYF